jgi:hypothetical protein
MSIRSTGTGYVRIALGAAAIDPTTTGCTAVIWFKKVGNFVGYDPILSVGVTGSSREGLETYNNGSSGVTGALEGAVDGSGLGFTTPSVPINTWRIAAIARPAGQVTSTISFYSGDENGLTAHDGIAADHDTPFAYIFFGEFGQPGLVGYTFDGELAYGGVFAQDLDPSDILAIMQAGSPSGYASCKAFFKFNDSSDHTDLSGNGANWTAPAGDIGNGSSNPPVSGSGNATITVPTGSLVIAGQSPQISGTALRPGTGALALTGIAPNLTQQFVRQPGSASLVFTGAAPNPQILGTIRPGAGTLTLTGLAPSVIQAHNRQPAAASLLFTGRIPQLNGSRTLQPGTGSIAFTGGSVLQTLTVPPPGAAALTLTGAAPQVIAQQGKIPGTAALSLSGKTPLVTQQWFIRPNAGSITVQGYAPGNSGVTIRPASASLNIAGQTPFVQGALTIQPGTGALIFQGVAPALSGANIIRPAAGALTFAGVAPNRTSGVGRVPGSASLSLSGVAPTVRVPIFLTPDTGSLQIFGQLSPSAGTGGGDGTDGGSGLVQRRAARQGLRRPIRLPLRAM